MGNVHKLDFPPRPLKHDITDVDVASRIRLGMVTRDEMRERFQNCSFQQWFRWRGVDLISHRIATFASPDAPERDGENEAP